MTCVILSRNPLPGPLTPVMQGGDLARCPAGATIAAGKGPDPPQARCNHHRPRRPGQATAVTSKRSRADYARPQDRATVRPRVAYPCSAWARRGIVADVEQLSPGGADGGSPPNPPGNARGEA